MNLGLDLFGIEKTRLAALAGTEGMSSAELKHEFEFKDFSVLAVFLQHRGYGDA